MKNKAIQDIFLKGFPAFSLSHSLNKRQLKVASSIMKCRTASLGAHVAECPNCGHQEISYNSCRDRHCPLCGGLAKEKWIAKRVVDIVNTKHYHMVFTIPSELYEVALANNKVFYDALFEASKSTIMKICSDDKYLGATPGVTAVLHTWGQRLVYHPHIHMVVTSGGYKDGRWINKKRKGKVFIPIRVLSKMFRGKLVSLIRSLFEKDELIFNKDQLNTILDSVMKKKWVVYSKEPFKGNASVYAYLGRYTHRTAISNERIISFDDENVIFSYKDYSASCKRKKTTIAISEFIRLFLLHVLPSRFLRIRHWGIYSSRVKNTKLEDCRNQTLTVRPKTKINLYDSTAECIKKLYGIDITKCPICGTKYPIDDLTPS